MRFARYLSLLVCISVFLSLWPMDVTRTQSASPSVFGANTHIATTYPFRVRAIG